MSTRRAFIQQAGLLTAGLFLKPSFSMSKPINKVGLQLYSLREIIGKDVKGVIAKVAEAGYREVETYGYSTGNKFWGLDPKAFKQLLKSHNMTTPSGHYGLDNYISTGNDDELKANIDAACLVGQTYFTVPYLGESLRKSADDYKKVAEKLNKAAELCRKAKLKLAYHNHAFEFDKFGNTTGYEIMLKETDPALVKFELDLYWVVRAKEDPKVLFNQNPGRFVMWHVKDMDKANPELNTEIGTGSIDFKPIFAMAEKSGVEHIFVEQENFSMDPFHSITQSCDYVKGTLLK